MELGAKNFHLIGHVWLDFGKSGMTLKGMCAEGGTGEAVPPSCGSY